MAVSVAPLAPLHRIPHRSARGLLGVVNIGGRLAPAVSLGALLGIDEQHAPAVAGRHVFARLLVIAAQGQSFALPVAELRGVERYAAATLLPPAATVARIEPGCLAGVLALPAMQAGLLDGALLAQRLAGLLR
jgi:chemotaxis-related protein WspD